MAKKGQKFNKYTEELKLEIVNKYLNNQGTSRSLAKEYGISHKSIETMIYTFKRQGHLNNRNHNKGRKKEENIDYKERYEILKKYQAFLKAQREIK